MKIYKHEFNLFKDDGLGKQVLLLNGIYYTDREYISKSEEHRIMDYIDNHCVFPMTWDDYNFVLEVGHNPKLLTMDEILTVMMDAPHIKMNREKRRVS